MTNILDNRKIEEELEWNRSLHGEFNIHDDVSDVLRKEIMDAHDGCSEFFQVVYEFRYQDYKLRVYEDPNGNYIVYSNEKIWGKMQYMAYDHIVPGVQRAIRVGIAHCFTKRLPIEPVEMNSNKSLYKVEDKLDEYTEQHDVNGSATVRGRYIEVEYPDFVEEML